MTAFGAPERQPARTEHGGSAPRADAAARAARPGVTRLPGGLRPSQVPVPGQVTSPTLLLPGGRTVQRVRHPRPSAAGVVPVGPSAFLAQSVRDALRAPGQPLAASVRQEMEGRLGADFTDVRVHADATADQAARAVNARAFTAGSHIAFQGGGYDPTSADGKRTLAHELTHVIQQRLEPVSGTDAGGGLRVSHPGDRFERAAEASAQQAVADGRRSPAPRAAGTGAGSAAGHPVTPTGEAVPVQRSVGYEFEVVKDASSVVDANRVPKTDSKDPLVFVDASGQPASGSPAKPYRGHAYLSADNGNVEYVTGPLDTKAEVRSVVGGLVSYHRHLSSLSDGNRVKYTSIRAVDGKTYGVWVNRGTPDGRPQATIGLSLRQVVPLFAKLGEWQERAQRQPEDTWGVRESRTRSRSMESGAKPRMTEAQAQGRVAHRAGVAVAESVRQAQAVLAAMQDTDMDLPDGYIGPVERERVLGFLAIIFKTIFDAESAGTQWADDPKGFFSLMPRTDFISLFYLLKPATRRWLQRDLIKALEKTQVAGWLDEDVLRGYKGVIPHSPIDRQKRYSGPVKRAWLQSILDGKQSVVVQDTHGSRTVPGKDTLSPPPGFPRHHETPNPEGMGAMKTDDVNPHLALFELRGLLSSGHWGPVPADSWVTLAEVVFDLVEAATAQAGEEPQRGFFGELWDYLLFALSRGFIH